MICMQLMAALALTLRPSRTINLHFFLFPSPPLPPPPILHPLARSLFPFLFLYNSSIALYQSIYGQLERDAIITSRENKPNKLGCGEMTIIDFQ